MRTKNSFAQRVGPHFRSRPSLEQLEDRIVPGETLTGLLMLPADVSPLASVASENQIQIDDASALSIVDTPRADGTQTDLASDTDVPAIPSSSDGDATKVETGGAVAVPTSSSSDDSTDSDSLFDDGFSGGLAPPASTSVAPAAAVGNMSGMSAIGQATTAPGANAPSFVAPTVSLANAGAISMTDLVQSVGTSLAKSAVASAEALSGAGTASPNLFVKPTNGPSPNASSFIGYSPANIRSAYGVSSLSATGSGVTIAIVDAFDAPNISSDLASFDSQYNVPFVGGGSFTKVFAQGSKPRFNSGWAQEITLDVEWAHAMAPGAKIVLEEAKTNSFSNLLGAVDDSVSRGATVVSMSWSGGDSSSDTSFDAHFNVANVTFLASAGDTGGAVGYPSTSPYVISAGGTSLPFDSNLNPIPSQESAWSSGGGGPSTVELRPGYQTGFYSGAMRGTPDISSDSDPNTGVSVIYNGNFYIFGGTSVAAPTLAGEIALADQGRATPLTSSNVTSRTEYNAATTNGTPYGTNYASNYRDITTGSNGYPTLTGYDLATGLGVPQANNLVPWLKTNP